MKTYILTFSLILFSSASAMALETGIYTFPGENCALAIAQPNGNALIVNIVQNGESKFVCNESKYSSTKPIRYVFLRTNATKFVSGEYVIDVINNSALEVMFEDGIGFYSKRPQLEARLFLKQSRGKKDGNCE